MKGRPGNYGRERICLAEAEEILLVEWDELKIEEKTKAIRFWKC